MKKILYMLMATGLLTFASCASTEDTLEREAVEVEEDAEEVADEIEDEIDR